ncbi:DUF7287 family protein [Halorarius litoreus]|uniref:DUF7287 family protein n=1 Tax=Halorarius litoreus TaxID=2962676 RepID=UPI0020CEDA99|nr:hypothetical protein [Halorarius litoreus]
MRAQTTLDFAIGTSIFIIVVAFVLAFVPGMLQPFEASTQQETAAADRIADQLVTDVLVEDVNSPFVLDRECTLAFFAPENNDDDGTMSTSYPVGADCNFPATDSLPERLSLSEPLNIRLRLVRDLTTVEADDPDGDMGGDDDEIDTLCVDESDPNGPDPRIVEANDPGPTRQCDLTGSEADLLFDIGGDPPESVGSVVVSVRTVHLEGGFADGTHDARLIVEVW